MSTDYYRLNLDMTLRELLRLASEEGRQPAVRSYWAGVTVGKCVEEDEVLEPSDVLISEYGDILTVAALRATAGAGRAPSTGSPS